MHHVANFVRRHVLWWLVAVYLVAGLFPQLGLASREWNLAGRFPGGEQAGISQLLVALLLFIAAASIDLKELRSVGERPWSLLAALVLVWLGPLLVALAAAFCLPMCLPMCLPNDAATSIALGALLVAAMPVANSSVAWTQHAAGDVPWSLALVVLSIVLCPWITPGLLGAAHGVAGSAQAERIEELVTRFSGGFFMAWVLAPTILGIALRQVFSAARIERLRPAAHFVSIVALLLLNYLNAALAIPQFLRQPSVGVAVAIAAVALAISLVGVLSAWLLSRSAALETPLRTALVFGLGMKHTGLALSLAGAVLVDQPLAILVVVMATLAQHLVAGALSRKREATVSE